MAVWQGEADPTVMACTTHFSMCGTMALVSLIRSDAVLDLFTLWVGRV